MVRGRAAARLSDYCRRWWVWAGSSRCARAAGLEARHNGGVKAGVGVLPCSEAAHALGEGTVRELEDLLSVDGDKVMVSLDGEAYVMCGVELATEVTALHRTCSDGRLIPAVAYWSDQKRSSVGVGVVLEAIAGDVGRFIAAVVDAVGAGGALQRHGDAHLEVVPAAIRESEFMLAWVRVWSKHAELRFPVAL